MMYASANAPPEMLAATGHRPCSAISSSPESLRLRAMPGHLFAIL
ncbi:hypothetical protein [Formivibrio citricus]|nr:hypothetical protein [Formivibrio citricus]